ncbi:MAG: DUF2007 domain-containing protein [Candidatus Omnitrophota bacterium]
MDNNEFVRVHSVSRPDDLALIKSILQSRGIEYFIKGENFGTLYGPADGLSLMDVMVREGRLDEAKELLKGFINPPQK